MLKLQMLDLLSLMFDALKKTIFILRREESTSILLSTCESCHFVNLQTGLSVDKLFFFLIFILAFGVVLYCEKYYTFILLVAMSSV